MANDRRAAVVNKLFNQAGLKAGDLTRLAGALPPQTIAQFDKLLNRKEPSVGPGMDSGVVVAYKSGEVVRGRPMQGDFSKEGIAVYEAGGAVERLTTRDPRVQYPTGFLPFGVLTEPDPAGSLLSEQRTVLAMPELARGLIEGITAPNQVRQGKMDPMTGAMLTAGAAPVGGLLARAPAGALGMNVFHGTPHKFAPEPGFPQGRPRLDKMGTGEGGQNYGKGFYSAESEEAGIFYRDNIPSRLLKEADEDSIAYDVASYLLDDVGDYAQDRAVRSYLRDGHIDHVFEDGSFYRIRNNEIEGTPFAAPNSSLYKLDIPDADAAKLLDYDAPISQQPQVVQNAINRLGFMPGNPDRMAGGDVWYQMRQQLGEDEAAAAMREAGVPGLRYKDAGSRGTDRGTRNFVVWDQDVLDRTKILKRNEERFAHLDQEKLDDFFLNMGDEGAGMEFPEVFSGVDRYVMDVEFEGLDDALRSVEYPEYQEVLRANLDRLFPEGAIPVKRVEGYGRGPDAVQDTKYFEIQPEDVVFAGSGSEKELIIDGAKYGYDRMVSVRMEEPPLPQSYEDGGAVDVGENKFFFTIGDLISRVREEGLPANARAYLRSVFERATGGEPPVFGADYFTDRQLERIREMAEARQRHGYEDVEGFAYPDTPSMESNKYYEGPSLPYGLDSLLTDIYNQETTLETSLGGFQIYDEGDHWRINDPFDFVGLKVKGLDAVRRRVVDNNAYGLLRDIAPTLIAQESYASDEHPDEWIPRFSFTIPKEGPVREGPGERPPLPQNYEDGGAVEPRPTGLTLSNGRPVWQSGDDMYSEKTITVPYGEGWVNVPTVDVDGSILSEEEVIRLLDQIGPVDIVTGEPLPVFDRLAVAEQKASQRSVNLNMELKDATQEQAPPVALELSDDVYLRPQFDARFGIGERNRRVPFFEDTVTIRDRNMGGIARLGAEVGFPGFSGNDRLSGGVTGTYDRTKRLFPDEYKPFGYPSDARFGPRGVVPVGYDVNYSSGKHKFSANVTPRQEGVSRDAPGGRSVYNLGYTYSTPEASYYLEATPFGVRENPDPKTGAAKMVRPFRAGVKIPF